MKKKRLIATVTALTLAASLLAGCGGKSPAPAADSGTPAASEETSPEASSAVIEEAGPFDFASVSDVTFPLKEKLTLTVFVYGTTTGGGTFQDNYVTDWIEEKTNIHLDYVYDLDGDDAKTKLNLVMTDAASMPDIFLATNWTKAEVQSYGQQGLLVPLNDYLADAPNWNRLNEASPMRKADLVMPDGNIYTYGDDNECFHCMYQNRMWLYMPWIEKLNDGKIPQTTDELYEYLTKIKTQDPNGNGVADEIPISGYIGGWASDPTVWLINSFIQCNNPLSNTNPTVGAGLVVNNGKIEYSVMKDEYKEGLRFINKLYKEGLLDNQTFTQDNTQFMAAADNEEFNIVGMFPGGGNSVDWDHRVAQEDGRWQDWVVMEPVAGPGNVRLSARSIQGYFASSHGSVSVNCKYPLIAVALFDFLASEEGTLVQGYGPEGYAWQWASEGTPLGGDVVKYERLSWDGEEFDWIGNGFAKNYEHWYYTSDAAIKSNTAAFRAALLVDNPEYNGEYQLQKAAESYAKYAPGVETLVPNLVFEGQDAQNISEKTLTIGGYVNQACVQFITGDMDVDVDWDTYLKKLDDMGVQEYLEIYQKYYDTYIANAK